MILSMTGFGRSEGIYEGRKIVIDLKSLNSKSFDLTVKTPSRYREKEYELRKILSEQLQRGKVDCYMTMENSEENTETVLHHDLIRRYIQDLKTLAADGPDFEYLKMAVRMPDATAARADDLSEAEWNFVLELLQEAIARFKEFRQTEGSILQQELQNNLMRISQHLTAVEPFESVRLENVKERYKKTLDEFEQLDETRFYQEMAYYTEKLDIAEEKVRLTQHLAYYQEVMEQETGNGKKLGFIAQEMGREINTLGSKANHADIQRLVVMMKDDLEKIKEQTLNVL
ncbi:YicC family protein [Chryseobacterium salipaludis]|uniref:YicC/YloC family endoribonuclease n=1 Tax=Chryseobacterium TaxID=59732 RepID=UPI001FF1CEC3|nr:MULTISPECIES: YicC/YloC family endoribonuclease [Chryseobacterium]MCJ8498641.1 YicC family protein [Chryseobacterium salipaludis]MCX3297709.1 YicC family protein [Planobacterium sp. JC490]